MFPAQEKPQTINVENSGTNPLEIMVEVAPDLYVLQPGDKMEIEAMLHGAPLHINAYDGGLQIYLGNANDHVAKINGTTAQSWT